MENVFGDPDDPHMMN